ncbi:MAG: B12-binding domain-containing radical SAM protein [Spirochaetia bacterium]
MKAVIAVPPVSDFYFTPHRAAHLGAHTALSAVKSLGFDTEIVLPGSKTGKAELPENLYYIVKNILPGEFGPISYFTEYLRFGRHWKTVAERVLQAVPDIVLLSSFAFAYAEDAIQTARELKKIRPELPIFACGAGASVFPEYYLQSGLFTAVLAGEAETVLPEFLPAFSKDTRDISRIPGVFTLNNIQQTQGIAAKQTTAKEIIPMWSQTYSTRRMRHISFTYSRGCNKQCSFCANRLCHGNGLRTASIESISAAIKEIPTDLPLRINLEDDNLLADKDTFFTVLKLLKKHCNSVSFTAENGIDYTLMDKNTIDHLVDAGFYKFNFSLVSKNSTLLQRMHRYGSTETLTTLCNRLLELEIPVITYFICGFPGDTKENIINTLDFLMDIPSDIGISLFYPVPGIPGFGSRNQFPPGSAVLCTGAAAYPWSGDLTTMEMVTAFRLARFCNLLKKSAPNEIEERIIRRSLRERTLITSVKIQDNTRLIQVPNLSVGLVEQFFATVVKKWEAHRSK